MKAQKVLENMGFKRTGNVKKTLGLGRPFGFSPELLDLSFNNGNKSLVVTPQFCERITGEITERSWLRPKPGVIEIFKGIIWGHNGKKYWKNWDFLLKHGKMKAGI